MYICTETPHMYTYAYLLRMIYIYIYVCIYAHKTSYGRVCCNSVYDSRAHYVQQTILRACGRTGGEWAGGRRFWRVPGESLRIPGVSSEASQIPVRSLGCLEGRRGVPGGCLEVPGASQRY